jgi:hypothetical protein
MSSWQERVSWTRDVVLERESPPELVCNVLESEKGGTEVRYLCSEWRNAVSHILANRDTF